MAKRDGDFRPGVKRTLREQVAFHCSNPACWVSTVSAGDGPNDVTVLGDAAHIHAAQPNGPRYLASMTMEERKDISNGIWLCQPCARAVDSEVSAHTADLLRSWKSKAIARVRSERMRTPPGVDDGKKELVAALRGVPASDALLINAIPNTHAAIEKLFEARDSRFKVETTFADGRPLYKLFPQENIDLGFKLSANNAAEWSEKLTRLHEHGEAAVLDARGVRVTGSPLLDELSGRGQKNGQYVFSRVGLRGVAKLIPLQPDAGLLDVPDEFHGHLSGGAKSVTFIGDACNKLLSLSVKSDIQAKPTNPAVRITGNFTAWLGQNVAALAFFEKVHFIYSTLARGSKFKVSVESKGQWVMRCDISTNASMGGTWALVSYIAQARKLAEYSNREVVLDMTEEVTGEQRAQLGEAVRILEGQWRISKADLDGSNLLLHCVATPELLSAFSKLSPEEACASRIEEPPGQITVFGQVLPLPSIRHDLSGYKARLPSPLPAPGAEIVLEICPLEDFEYTRSFVSNEGGEAGVMGFQ